MAFVPEGIKDILPIPDNLAAVTEDEPQGVAYALSEQATTSHALAVAKHDKKGHAQTQHDAEVKDLGWTEESARVPNPLLGGIHNEELWLLIRRFDKQVYYVKETPNFVPGNLDFNIADEEEFSPDKLRATLERLYMSVGIGLIAFVKHIVRLRSWRERQRTTAFCVVYFLAWFLDLLVPAFVTVLLALVLYPPSRAVLFPPAPIALVSASTGGIQKPKAGVLGSTDSATGAPENYKGEAVEAEASNFVNSIASVALSSASGKHPQADPPPVKEENGKQVAEQTIPDPTAVAMSASQARAASAGKNVKHHDKTKAPMESTIWNAMRPLMHGLGDVADTWERMCNALSPTPPFPSNVYHLRMATVLVPVLAGSIFVTSYMIMKGVGFGIGFGFFGDPVISATLRWLDRRVPNWKRLLELRNTLLRGVPTNAQLAVTLLRIGEANKAPLPPPPYRGAPPPDEPAEITEAHLRATGADWPLNATEEELQEAMAHDPSVPHQSADASVDAAKTKSHGKGARILAAVKASVKGTVETTMGADRLKAKAGSEHSRQRLGVIPKEQDKQLSGPVDFRCRFHGKRGHAYLSTQATIPCISFSLDKNVTKDGNVREDEELHPVWSVAVADIAELRKIGGLGWKAKLLVGWALDREIADGIEIVDKRGASKVLTAMVLRDQLFNRLVAMGGQKWESW